MTATRAAQIQTLDETRPNLVAIVGALSNEQMDYRPGAEEWSIREILAHLVDDEIYVMRTRLERIIKEEVSDLAPHDERYWYANCNKTRDARSELLDDFDLQRCASLGILYMLRDSDWARTGLQLEYGRFSAEEWIGHWVEHDRVHLRQIENNLKAHAATQN